MSSGPKTPLVPRVLIRFTSDSLANRPLSISPTKAGKGVSWVKTKGPHGAKDTQNMLVIVLFIDCTILKPLKHTPSPNSEPKPTFGQVQKAKPESNFGKNSVSGDALTSDIGVIDVAPGYK